MAEFSLEDVHKWIDCDRAAGAKIWFESSFYDAMTFRAVKQVRADFGARWFFVTRRLQERCFNLEELARNVVSEVAIYIKTRRER